MASGGVSISAPGAPEIGCSCWQWRTRGPAILETKSPFASGMEAYSQVALLRTVISTVNNQRDDWAEVDGNKAIVRFKGQSLQENKDKRKSRRISGVKD